MNKKVYLTKKGLQDIKREYDELINVKRPQIIKDIQETRSLGDLSENAGYHSAKEQQSFVESRINEIEEILKNAVVEEIKLGEVGVGSKVTLKMTNESSDFTYQLVSSAEASPMDGKISYESPIGKSLLNSKVGDIVSVQTPAGTTEYKIIKVE